MWQEGGKDGSQAASSHVYIPVLQFKTTEGDLVNSNKII
jgi:hypothetical protein